MRFRRRRRARVRRFGGRRRRRSFGRRRGYGGRRRSRRYMSIGHRM